jgi:hypothetical protein
MTSCYQPTIHAQRHAAIRQTSGLSIVNPTAMLETNGLANCLSVEIGTRFKRNFHRPALFGASPISLDAGNQGEWY